MAHGDNAVHLVRIGVVAFFAASALLLAGGDWLVPLQQAEPTYAVAEKARANGDGTFQVTLDSSDVAQWVGFDFATGHRVPADWVDLAVRRQSLRAPRGAVDLGYISLATATLPQDPAWQGDERVNGVRHNPILSAWYDYSLWTSLLRSKQHTFAVRTRNGGVAYVQIRSYYCKPQGSGCLTLRYRLEQ